MSTLASVIIRGLYSALPAAGIAGRLYFCSDSTGTHVGQIYYDDGSAWDGPYGTGGAGLSLEVNGTANASQTLLNLISGSGATVSDGGSGNVTIAASGGGGGGMGTPFTPPPMSGWSWANQGSATVNNTSVSASMTIPTSGSLNWRLQYRAQPSTPYALSAFYRTLALAVNAMDSGIYFYDSGSTKMLGIEYLMVQNAAPGLRVERINSPTSDNSTVWNANGSNYPGHGGPTYGGGIWVRLRNDGTNLYFDIGNDGADWQQIYTEAVGAFITPDSLAFGGVSDISSGQTGSGSFNLMTSVLSWAH